MREESVTETSILSGQLTECKYGDDFLPENYYLSLLYRLGFNFNQLIPRFGLQENRFASVLHGNISFNDRYLGCSFFTTNSELTIANAQSLNSFSQNQSGTFNGTAYDFKGKPEFNLSFLNQQLAAVSVNSAVMRGDLLPQKLDNPYYLIQTSIPSCSFFADNNILNFSNWVMRQ